MLGPEIASETIFVQGAGARLAVHLYGEPEARPVIAVHGFASSAQVNWVDAGWVRALLAEGYRVIAPDLRGHGESDAPHDPAAYSFDTLLDDVRRVIAATTTGPVDYLGYSLGARLGWELGSAADAHVRTLSLGGLPDRDPLTAFDAEAARAFVTSGTPITDPLTAGFIAMAQGVPGNDIEALVALVEGVQGTDLGSGAPGVPTLVVIGEKDELASGGPAIAARAPQGRFVGLPGRTHVNAVSARGFKTAVLELLAAH